MSWRHRMLLASLALTVLVASAPPAAPAAAVTLGLVVERTKANYAADRAGIQEGDVLISWSQVLEREGERFSERRVLATAFDLAEVEREHRPRYPVVLHGRRGQQPVRFFMGPGRWRIRTKPRWDDTTAARYGELLTQLGDGPWPRVTEASEPFSEMLQSRGGPVHGAWFWLNAAEAVRDKGRLDVAARFYGRAIEVLTSRASRPAVAFLQHRRGMALMYQSRFKEALEAFTSALQTEKSIGSDRLGVAANLLRQGSVLVYQDQFDRATAHLEKGLRIVQEHAPDTMMTATAFSEMGRAADGQGDLARAENFFRRALQVTQALVPDGAEVVAYLTNAGISVHKQGDQAGAEALYVRAQRIVERLDPESLVYANVLNNLGTVKQDRGDHRAAQHYFRRAFLLSERLAPQSPGMLVYLGNLGVAAMDRGDWEAAEMIQKRIYAIRKDRAPESAQLATTLSHLGRIARAQRNYDAAESYLREAIAIVEKAEPTNYGHARSWLDLGFLERERGNETLAAQHMNRALSLSSAIAPEGRSAADALTGLAHLARAKGELADAERYYSRALAITKALAPQTYVHAEVLHGLARVSLAREDRPSAQRFFERAVDALDAQHVRLGGTEEARASARAQYLEIYRDYIDLLLAMNAKEKAFAVLERSRSKVFSELLAERELLFNADLPAPLERERRVQARRYEQIQSQLLNSSGRAQAERLRAELQRVRQRRRQIQERIREHAPQLVDLQYPKPASVADTRRLLGPQTAVISYSAGEQSMHMFVVSGRGLEVHTLALGREELDALTTRFRLLIDAGRMGQRGVEPLTALAKELYQKLVLPAERAVSTAKRLLIVPDGSLNLLPFAALMRSTEEGTEQYLAEWKPSLTVSSLAVYAQLQRPTTDSSSGGMIAFGDPDYSHTKEGRAESARVSDWATRGLSLSALPWSREEVERIGAIYEGNAEVLTGPEANEKRAKQLSKGVRYVHFATHAVLDQRNPMDTAIVLSATETSSHGEDNGFLQAWEIYERIRLEADLVTLSACDTALGTPYPGEGLLGLTRAFQYAGASSVLASLWKVSDRSTSQLMSRFYAHAKAGLSLESSLQRAQIAMIRSGRERGVAAWFRRVRAWLFGDRSAPDPAHPYSWAGFVLSGRGGS